MNELRVPLIRDGLLANDTRPPDSSRKKLLEGFSILDVGCGGGILSEVRGNVAKTEDFVPLSEMLWRTQDRD